MYRTPLVTFVLFLIGLTARPQVTVHPGDANNNGLANHVDLLYVGLGNNVSGPARDSASINWTPQISTFNWQLNFPTGNGLNYAYFDCNGDGQIDAVDQDAIEQNYDLTHGQVVPDTSTIVATGAPQLMLEFQQDSFQVSGDSLIMVNILLGSSSQPVTNLYGVAFTVDFDPAIVDSVFYYLPGGFISGGTFTLNMGHVRQDSGKLELAITRTNQTAVSGFGVIGTIGIVMDDDLRITQDFSLPVSISQIHALGLGGTFTGLTPVSDTLFISTLTLGLTELLEPKAIFPQPATDYLVIQQATPKLEQIDIYNVQGILVRSRPCKGLKDVRLDLHSLPEGTYFLHGRAKDQVFRKSIVVVRQ